MQKYKKNFVKAFLYVNFLLLPSITQIKKTKNRLFLQALKNALSLQPSGGSIQTGTSFDYQYSSFGSLSEKDIKDSIFLFFIKRYTMSVPLEILRHIFY